MLTGKVIGVGGGCCLLDVNGVGYEVRVPLPALEDLAQAEGQVRLHTYLHLREDDIQLFGFLAPEEKAVFEKIIGVSGIGPKTALSILSVLPVDRFRQAVESEDFRLLSSVPGVGQKSAQRLVLELRGKLGRPAVDAAPAKTSRAAGEMADAVEALVALGYPAVSATQAVEASLAEDAGRTAPVLVREALKKLAR